MPYRVLIERKAAKEADGVPAQQRTMIDKAVLALAGTPRPRGARKLTEKEGYRIRVGNYRILYSVDDSAQTVVIYRITIRSKETYR